MVLLGLGNKEKNVKIENLNRKLEYRTARKPWPAITKPKRHSNIGCKGQAGHWKGPWWR